MNSKETILKWLRNCSEEGSGELCSECPFNSCEDCGGALMKAAAEAMEGEKD